LTDQKKATLFALCAVFIWSTVASAFKISLRYLEPIQLLLYAGAFATVVLGIFLIRQGKLHQIFRCSKQQYRTSLLLGILNPFLYYLVLLKAYDLLPAQQAQPLNYTWAITLTLLSIPLLKQRISRYELLALVISYLGVLVISTEGSLLDLHFTSPGGVALALGSTLIWALFWIFNTRDTRDPVIALFINFLFSFPFILVYCLIFSEMTVPPWEGILGAAYIGIFEMGISFVLWLLALRYTENTARISNLIFIAPFFSLVIIHFLVGEEILPVTFIGLLLIVLGLACQQFAIKRTRRVDGREG